MVDRILCVEGNRANSPSFVPGLRRKNFHVEAAASGEEAMSFLPDFDPDLIVVNAASLRSSGKRICRTLREKSAGVPLVLIIDPERAQRGDTCANVVLSLPFTLQKLLNRIKRLLPGEGYRMFHTGPIRLDLERKRVRCAGREATLTPRLTLLLKLLMDHHGEVVEREEIIRQVWNTEYVGDTRTLDVHISWLRHAIEVDAHKPRYLKTIRGLGYRLDI